MKHFFILVVSALAVAMSTTFCAADLVLDISGVAGSGVTTWEFSGEDVAGAPEQFNFEVGALSGFGDPPLDDSIFAQQGDLFKTTWNSTDNKFMDVSAGITVTTAAGTRNINKFFCKENFALDDIGFYVDGSSDLEFAIGETVTWNGSLDLSIDLNDFNQGSYTFNYFAFIFDTLDLTVNISEASAVPEPSTSLYIGLTCLTVLLRRRKRLPLPQ
ncbi:MAG: PEP-CTERM sorting domain-containing protein [Mariniblastus sp.]|nr:PEP-CTERM sorting domain-containing protein [Mariniblastus sp.]